MVSVSVNQKGDIGNRLQLKHEVKAGRIHERERKARGQSQRGGVR